MSFIHVLDENTINQIAAGEVVERPSAIVKELIENAMDAGATAITAEIKEGGLSFIRITDNGSGISKEDIPLAFLRHATSKIRSAEDLLSVTSLGFRGEALSSIAAVAQVELITKTPTALNGYRYVIEGGNEKSMEEIGCPGGTTIIVRNIFYNTPARRNFLKSAMTEAGYITDLMERLIVSHPEVAFKFIMNNQVKLQSSGNNNTKDILYHIYGRDISKELIDLEYSTGTVKVSGYIGKPIINRGNRNFENYFINGRYIKSNVITKAIEEAYKPFLMQHKYPFTSIYYEIDPALIDVNVHPQKMEIRLKNGDEIYQFTYHVIRNSLAGKEMIPKVLLTEQEEKKAESISMPEPFEQNRRQQLNIRPTVSNNTNASFTEFIASNKAPQKSYQYNTGKDHPYHKIAEKNSDYITATEPLINSSSPLVEALIGEKSPSQYTDNDKTVIGSKDIREAGIRKENAQYEKDKEAFENNSLFNKDLVNNKQENKESGNKDYVNKDLGNKDLGYEDLGNKDLGNEDLDKRNPGSNDIESNDLGNVNRGNRDLVDKDLTVASQKDINQNTFSGPKSEVVDDPSSETQKAGSEVRITSSEQLKLFSDAQENEPAPFLSKQALEDHRIIGQLFSTYWLVEYKKELYIIDQHAAHEKVLYERIMMAAKSKTHASQQLLPPIVLSLTLREQEILQKQEEVLNSLGYEFEYFGGNEYSVRAVPADLYSISEKELLLEFLDNLADDLPGASMNTTSILERAASMSCKAAVKANHILSYEEANSLIKELLTLENPYHCPHGRPVIISMSQYELERKFKRIL